ncbi:acyltransferase family protein, partial [Paenibacillus sp. GCM10012303]|uniref:acyltransferase family protein n=1 Tax=Paenibacillus sp. GCM10012303 TaxID=3317340 RepID=UPI0036229B93
VYHFILNLGLIQSGWFEFGYSFNAPTWSISAELVVYLIFFIILFKLPKERRLIMYILMVFIGLTIQKINLNYPLINLSMSRVFVGFFIGCLTYEACNTLKSSKMRGLILTLSGLGLLIVIASGIIFGHKAFGNWTTVYTLIIYPLIIVLSINITVLNSILSFRPLVYLGSISYSIYLWHFPLQLIIKTMDDTLLLGIDFTTRKMFLGFLFLTLIISIVSYELIEKPAQNYLRNRFLKQKS